MEGPVTLFDVLASIEENNAGERTAMQGYYNLMDFADKALEANDISREERDEIVAVVSEIISDEMNHSGKLAELACKMSMINPATD